MTATAQSEPDASRGTTQTFQGVRLPSVKAGESPPHILSSEFANILIGIFNAFANLKVQRLPAQNGIATGEMRAADGQFTMVLYDT